MHCDPHMLRRKRRNVLTMCYLKRMALKRNGRIKENNKNNSYFNSNHEGEIVKKLKVQNSSGQINEASILFEEACIEEELIDNIGHEKQPERNFSIENSEIEIFPELDDTKGKSLLNAKLQIPLENKCVNPLNESILKISSTENATLSKEFHLDELNEDLLNLDRSLHRFPKLSIKLESQNKKQAEFQDQTIVQLMHEIKRKQESFQKFIHNINQSTICIKDVLKCLNVNHNYLYNLIFDAIDKVGLLEADLQTSEEKFSTEKEALCESFYAKIENISNKHKTDMEMCRDEEERRFCAILAGLLPEFKCILNRLSVLKPAIDDLVSDNAGLKDEILGLGEKYKQSCRCVEEQQGDLVDLNLRIQDLEKINKMNKENSEFLNKENFELKSRCSRLDEVIALCEKQMIKAKKQFNHFHWLNLFLILFHSVTGCS